MSSKCKDISVVQNWRDRVKCAHVISRAGGQLTDTLQDSASRSAWISTFPRCRMEAIILKMLIWWDSLTPGGGKNEWITLNIHGRIERMFYFLFKDFEKQSFIFLSRPVTPKMIQDPHQVITSRSNSSEGKGAPWTKREISSWWLSWSNQMSLRTILTSLRAKERWQSCRPILDFISTKYFTDVFMSLIRMVIYLQSFFSQCNIPQTSVAHIWSATRGRGGEFLLGTLLQAGQPAGPWLSPWGYCLRHYMLLQL